MKDAVRHIINFLNCFQLQISPIFIIKKQGLNSTKSMDPGLRKDLTNDVPVVYHMAGDAR